MARLACASLVKYCRGWFPFYSDVTICECQFSATARYVKKKLPILRQVRNHTVWRTFERLGYSYKARRRNAAVAEKHKPARLAYCDWVEKQDQEDVLVATLLALGASPAGETPKTLERLRRAMASRHALLHAHASLDPNVAIRFMLGCVKLCTIV